MVTSLQVCECQFSLMRDRRLYTSHKLEVFLEPTADVALNLFSVQGQPKTPSMNTMSSQAG